MSGPVTYVYVGVLASWLGYVLFLQWTEAEMAVVAGVLLGAGLIHGLRNSVAVRGLVAVLEPVGIVLPLLALWHMVVTVVPGAVAWTGGWNGWALLAFLLGYVAFLAASMGVTRVTAYPLGYRAGPVGIMVLALCLVGLATGQILLPVIAVAGQVMWTLRIGSSNWFDHVLHVLLVPVVAVELISRVL